MKITIPDFIKMIYTNPNSKAGLEIRIKRLKKLKENLEKQKEFNELIKELDKLNEDIDKK